MAYIDAMIAMLNGLRVESVTLQHYCQTLADAIERGCPSRVVLATGQLYRAVDTFESTVATLLGLVTEMDCGLGQRAMISLAELGLCCRTIGILSQVEQLAVVLGDPCVHMPELFTGKLRSIDEVTARIHEAIARAWTDCRGSGESVIASTWTDRRLSGESVGPAPTGRSDRVCHERTAIQQAQRAMAMLGQDPELMHFLRAGMARPDLPGIFGACSNITALLEIRLSVEPDPAIFGASPDPRLTNKQQASVLAGVLSTARCR